MSEMIERVAIAIGEKLKPALEGGKPVSLSEVARAAIEAMRVPTEEMLAAFAAYEDSEIHPETFAAMIDAALGKVSTE